MKIEINVPHTCIALVVGFCTFIATLTSYGYLGLQTYIGNEMLFALLIMLLCRKLYKIDVISIPQIGTYFCLLLFAMASELLYGRSHLLNLVIMAILIPALINLPNACYRFLIMGCIVAQGIFFIQFRAERFFNSYAMTTALSILGILLFWGLYRRKNVWLQLIVFALSVAFLLVLGSRTALLAFAASGLISIFGTLASVKRNHYLPLIVVSVILIVLVWLYYDKIYEFLFTKWEQEGYSSDDISSGRFAMWESVFKNDLTWFGHKDGFVMNTYEHEDVHNIFIQVVVKYGLITAGAFIIWMADLVRRIIRLRGKAKIYFGATFTFFLLTGVFENVLFLDCKVFLITFVFLINLAWLYKISTWPELAETMFKRENP